jgi:CheY-like chemotaxis protein
VLVVDDNDFTLKLVCNMLEDLGFKVDAADGAAAAMQSFSQIDYGFVVSDLQMPEIDGYALATWLKHQSKTTKVIIMTGVPGSGKCGIAVVDWLFKPFGLNKLARLIGEFAPLDIL